MTNKNMLIFIIKFNNMKSFAKLKESLYEEALLCLRENRPRAKKIIKGYAKILKQHPALKEALDIHNNLTVGSFNNEEIKHGFIIENLTAIKRLNKDELRVGLDALDKFLKQNKIPYSNNLNTLNEKISSLMLNCNNVSKSIENNKAIEFIIESVVNRNVEEQRRAPVSHKIFKNVVQENYNNKYQHLNNVEKKIVKAFFSGNKNLINEQYEEIVTQIKKEVDAKIKETIDKDVKIKLFEVKDKLYEKPENITLEHFNKLLQLQENMS